MRQRIVAVLVLVWLVGITPTAAPAHPHAWIDIQVAVTFNDAGEATGLTETWLFDAFYTAYAVVDFDIDADGAPDPDKLAELLSINLEALAAFDYFTRVKSGTEAVALGTAIDASSAIEDGRLRMTFHVPFAAPVAVAETPLRYAVFDPTYYVEVVHAEVADAVRLTGAPETCSHRLAEPEPSPEMIAFALALDQTQSAGDTLGQHFAEWVTVRCT